MVVLTLRGNATVPDVDRLKLEIQVNGKGNTLRLDRCHGMTLEVARAIIEMLKLAPTEWNELVVNDSGCTGIYLEPLIDTIHKLNMFQAISYQHVAGSYCTHCGEHKRPMYGNASTLISFTRFQCHSLRTLKLSGQRMGHGNAVSLRKGLQDSTSLQELKLRFRLFENDAFHEVLQGLEANQSIQSLDLSDNGLPEPSTLALINGVLVPPHPKLTCLDLSRNSIGQSGLRALAHALEASDCRISDLKMNQTGLVNLRGLFETLSSDNASLKSLSLSDNRLLEGIPYILENLHKLQGLETLSIDCTYRRVSRGLKVDAETGDKPQNNNLKHLHLNANIFDDEGADTLLCFCADQFPMLETLTLVRTGLWDLSFPKFLSETTPPLLHLKQLILGVLEPRMLPSLSKLLVKLPCLIHAGAEYRLRGSAEASKFRFELDRRQFPVLGEIQPVALWPKIFECVNEYVSISQRKRRPYISISLRQKRRLELLHHLIQGPGMPLHHVALERGKHGRGVATTG